MIGWLLWFFAAPLVFVLDGVLAGVLPVHLDLAAALCLVFALHSRVAALPGLLFCAALGRGLLVDGDLPLHFLAMGLPIALLLPLRHIFDRRAVAWQFVAAAFFAVTVPRTTVFLGNLSGQDVGVSAGRELGIVLLSALILPLVAKVARSVPPLSLFTERSA
jgi:hypothetical protein